MRRSSKNTKSKNYYAQMDRGSHANDEDDDLGMQQQQQADEPSKRSSNTNGSQQQQSQQQKATGKSSKAKVAANEVDDFDTDIDDLLEDDLDGDLDSDEVDEFCSLNADFHDQKQKESKQQQQQQQQQKHSSIVADLNASKKEEQNCFLNPTLAAFNYGNLFYCNFCGFSANNTNKILHHLFVHVFKCQSCSHFTYTKYDLMKHIYKHHRPHKELQIKRLVLEVTSNDWYFLCSENEPHNLTQAALCDVDNDYDMADMNGAGGVGTGATTTMDDQIYRSIDTSEHYVQQSKSHQRITHSPTENPSQRGQSKKLTTNYFVQSKQQKSPEKLTQVQSKQSQSTSAHASIKRDLQPSLTNPLKYQSTPPAQQAPPKITPIVSSSQPKYTTMPHSQQPQKLATFIESTASSAQILYGTDSTSVVASVASVGGALKVHARKSTSSMSQQQLALAKAKKLSKKCRPLCRAS
jgi:hypothetical protein